MSTVLPGWHVVPSQQPPLQGEVALQELEQTPPLHASLDGHCVGDVQLPPTTTSTTTSWELWSDELWSGSASVAAESGVTSWTL
jgi:hypothetical protein